MRKKNGFTLVELLSTVVILGVVLSVMVYIVMKNINKAKDDTELITYNNIKNAAKVYTDEVASYWNVKDDYEYSCISLGNMIEIGYFNEEDINENDKFSKDTMLKIIRDKDSKVIEETSFYFEDSILPDVDCGYQSSISISTDNKGKKVKTTNMKILFNGLNDSYYRYFYLSGFDENTITTNDIVYVCEGVGNCSNNTVNNLESGRWYLASNDLVRLSVKSNGTISAFINYNSENVAEATKNIDFIDNTPPVISLSVNKIDSYNGNTPSTKGEFITNTNDDYVVSEWKNYGYWFDISTNEDTVIKWTYNNTNNVNGSSPSNSGANCNTSCSKTLSGDGNRKATIIATDEAGNSSKIEVNIYIDKVSPTQPILNVNGSNVTMTSSDSTSGIMAFEYRTYGNKGGFTRFSETDKSTITATFSNAIEIRAVDYAGNVSSTVLTKNCNNSGGSLKYDDNKGWICLKDKIQVSSTCSRVESGTCFRNDCCPSSSPGSFNGNGHLWKPCGSMCSYPYSCETTVTYDCKIDKCPEGFDWYEEGSTCYKTAS